MAAAVAGQDVNVAQLAGSNAVVNNYLKHYEVDELLVAKAACKNGSGSESACQTVQRLEQVSIKRDQEIRNCQQTNTCEQWLSTVQKDMADLALARQGSEKERDKYYGNLTNPIRHQLVLRDDLINAQFMDINAKFTGMGGYSQLFVNARDEYVAKRKLEGMGLVEAQRSFNQKYGYNEGGLTAAIGVLGGRGSLSKPSGGKPAAVNSVGRGASEASALRYVEEPSFNPQGTIGAAQQWSTKGRIKYVELPNEGKIRYVPPEGYSPSVPLPRGPNNGYIDKFGNEWIKGPSRTPGQAFEWDVQLSKTGQSQLGWATRDGSHLNVSLDGKITRK